MNIKPGFGTIAKALSLAACITSTAIADDIEIYTTANLGTTMAQPNVMFIIDSSGSMGAPLSVPTAYDHAQTYTGCYDASMLYFSSTGAMPTCGSKDKFLKTSNRCDASMNLYDKGVIIDPIGPLQKHGFFSDQVAQYNSKKNIWQAMSTKNGTEQAYLIECYADSGVHGESGAGNPYIDDGGPWTATVPANPAAPHPVWDNGANHVQIYDGNYLNYRVDPSVGASTVSRMQAAKDAVEAIVNANNNINIGLMRFDGAIGGGYEGGAVMYPALDVKANRNDFSSRLKTMTEGGLTTLSETYYEALQYFGGKEIVYGDNAVPSTQTGAKENGNPNFYQTPITAECQKNYIIYMTDGAPEDDYIDAGKRSALPNFPVGSCNTDPDPGNTTNYIEFNLDAFSSAASTRDNCLDELAAWAKHNDIAGRSVSEHDGKQTITTYTVGFDFSSSPNVVDQAALQMLKDTARLGGGRFYEAKGKDGLQSVFNKILAEILAVNSTFSSPAVSINAYNRATNLDDLYFSLFKPSAGARWDGNLKKYKLAMILDANGHKVPEIQDALGNPAVDPATGFFRDSSVSYWTPAEDAPDGAETRIGGAASMLTFDSARRAFTFTGTYSNTNGVATPTSASMSDLTVDANKLASTNANITDAMLGGVAANPNITFSSGSTTHTVSYIKGLLDWAQGQDILDEDGDFESMEARRIMGDPLHSEPALVQYGELGNGDPDLVAYVATNEGFLHGIDSLSGKENFAFMPQEQLPRLSYLFENIPASRRGYGLDGSVVAWVHDANKDRDLYDSGDHVYLYFGQRRGGSDIFSLDVTDRKSPKLRWIIKGGTGDFAELGQTWSTPNVERLKLGGTTKTVLIFGGGYDTGQDTVTVRTPDAVGRSVYIVDAETGELLWRAGPDAGADLQLVDMQYSIPGRIKPIDVDGNGYIDQLYLGDMGGQLWRIDIEESETSTDLPTLITGGRIADLALDASEIDTRRFYYPPDVALIVESGQRPYLAILAASGYRANPLNTVVHDRMYMLRLDDIYNPPANYITVTEPDLFDTTNNLIGEGTSAQKAGAISNLSAADGWYITFNELDGSFIGEKALSEPLIVSGAGIITTYVPDNLNPNSLSCTPKAGTGAVYYVNVTDGTPTYNIAGTVDRTREDRKEFLKRGGIPPSPSVILTDGGTPTMCVGTECGSVRMHLGLQKTHWYEIEH